MECVDMEQSNPADMVKNVAGIAGVAGGAALVAPAAPLVPPILHGMAGIAVVGLGLFAAGSLVMKAADSIKGIVNSQKPRGTTRPS
jgi:hypothetical protein